MSALICDICGGDIVMNSTGEFAVCESCGMKHSKERVQAKIQEIKGTVSVEGTVEVAGTVKVEGINDAEKLYENAKAFIKLGEFEKSKKVLEELVDKYPDDYRGWWGILELKTENFTKYVNFQYGFDFIKYFNNSITCSNDLNTRNNLTRIYEAWYAERYEHLSNSKDMNQGNRNEPFYTEGIENAQRCNRKKGVFKALGIDETYRTCKVTVNITNKVTYTFKKFIFINGYTACIEYEDKNTPNSSYMRCVSFSNNVKHNLDKYINDLPDGNDKSEFEGGCYVATCIYGSYDCPQVWTLRRFRDNTLAETAFGRAFIRTYYAISPILVKWFGNTYWFKKMWKGTLDKMVSKLQTNGVEDTPYQDRIW